MFSVETDHQVVAFGNDLMGLFDSAGEGIATATRAKDGWLVHAEGVKDTTAGDRRAAIKALTAHALAKLGPSGPKGRGYSTMVPHGLRDLP